MEAILKEFDKKQSLYNDFRLKISELITQLLKAKQINYHQITSRIKDKDSLSKKLSRKDAYTSLVEITDIGGCRIITYFEDDVDKVAKVIEREFEIDQANSIDKRKIDYDRFGYQSLHYVVSLDSKREALTENFQFKGLKAEIQIRSILQHGWAEIEHDIGYKGEHSIPDIAKRRFSRISALLETADLEFVALRNDLSSYEKNVEAAILTDPSNVKLDKASILSFTSTNQDLKKVDAAIAELRNIKLTSKNTQVETQIILLEFAGISTIQDLGENYKKYAKCILGFSKHWRRPSKNIGPGTGISGISLYDTAYYLLAKHKPDSELTVFFDRLFTRYKPVNTVKEIRDAFESLSSACKK
jgi:putative GTP pyrophosphokinase